MPRGSPRPADPHARQWVLSLAAVLILVAGLLPRGWMPVAHADGLTMVICTSAGAVESPIDLGGDGPAAPAPEGQAACGFASAGSPAPPPLADRIEPPASRSLAATPARAPPAWAPAGAPVRLPPSHAPPLPV